MAKLSVVTWKFHSIGPLQLQKKIKIESTDHNLML